MIRASVSAEVSPSRTRRVLHVCESFGAGVATSIHAMIVHVPEAEHTVLIVPHREHPAAPYPLPGVHYLDYGPRISTAGAILRIARTWREVQPDVVHAHSSFAGIYVRTTPSVPRSRIVYSPHCFSFEREDVSGVARLLVRLVERALARRVRTVVALGPREAALARALGVASTVEAPNVPNVRGELEGTAIAPHDDGPFTVMAAGRVCRQKDPGLFAEIAGLISGRGLSCRWVWIGAGDPELESLLRQAGVEVTGWRDRDSVLQTFASGHLCLHTAGWEAAPVTVLEAAAIGLPVLMRSIPATRDAPVGRLFATASDAAAEIERLQEPAAWRELRDLTQRLLDVRARKERLRRALLQAYQFEELYDAPPAPPGLSEAVP
jgi:glycosyltransferase involved in cell wall biosynthesis